MNVLPKPAVILTHESDLDGLVSGLLLQRLARHLFAVDVPLEAYHYQGWRQREMKDASAWVADFGFDPRLDRPDWLVIDHHPTEVKPQKARLIHALDKSAGQLCYELCQEQGLALPDLARIIHLNNVADLFLQDAPDFLLANDYANLVKVYQFWNVHTLIEGRLENLLDHPLLEVMATKRRIEDPLGLAWSRKNIVAITPAVGLVPTIVGNSNLIVYQLLDESDTPYKVLVTLNRRGASVTVASFRSRNGEALKVAEKLQGGGHPNACGATLPRSVRNTSDAVNYLRQVLNPAPKPPPPAGGVAELFSALD